MINEQLEQVKNLLKNEKAVDARNLFDQIPETRTVEYWFLKGYIEQKFQQWGKAYNAFSKVLEIDPGNIEAKSQIHFINGILSFWNPDQFNP